jgi:hypothetical protein
VSPRWLAESRKAGLFLDPWTFILRDEANEKKWGFKLETTLHQVKVSFMPHSVVGSYDLSPDPIAAC